MGWIIICIVIAIFCSYIEFEDFSMLLMSAFLGMMLGVVFYVIIGGCIGESLPVEKVIKTQQICALTDNSSIEKRDYLFSGYIDEKLIYRYVVDTEIGKHIEEIDDAKVYIKEGDYSPTVEHHYYVLKKEWHKWFANTIMIEDYYVFYVPENTVTSKYNIDLN